MGGRQTDSQKDGQKDRLITNQLTDSQTSLQTIRTKISNIDDRQQRSTCSYVIQVQHTARLIQLLSVYTGVIILYCIIKYAFGCTVGLKLYSSFKSYICYRYVVFSLKIYQLNKILPLQVNDNSRDVEKDNKKLVKPIKVMKFN